MLKKAAVESQIFWRRNWIKRLKRSLIS